MGSLSCDDTLRMSLWTEDSGAVLYPLTDRPFTDGHILDVHAFEIHDFEMDDVFITGNSGQETVGGWPTSEANCDSVTTTPGALQYDMLIATPDGQRPIQDLVPGDRLWTTTGEITTVRQIHLCPQPSAPSDSNTGPLLRIEKDAIADGVPALDLDVTPDLAVEIDGVLYTAASLVNGLTIYPLVTQADADQIQTCFAIETGRHELILAQNCPCETLFDLPVRGRPLGNQPLRKKDDTAQRATPNQIVEMTMMRVATLRLLPQSLRNRLLARAKTGLPTETAA